MVQRIGRNAPQLAFLLIFIVMAVIALAIIKDAPVINKLSEAAFARGLITFIISISTIGLAFVLVFQSFAAQEDKDSDARFRRAREIFTVLMGVLGTIVGFYFGSTSSAVPALQIAPIKLSNNQLVTHIAGGVAPYRYTITSDEDKGFPPLQRTSEDGWLVEGTESLPAAGKSITLEVKDARDQTVRRTFTTAVELPPPPAPKLTNNAQSNPASNSPPHPTAR